MSQEQDFKVVGKNGEIIALFPTKAEAWLAVGKMRHPEFLAAFSKMSDKERTEILMSILLYHVDHLG